jgi:hypothetical protein
MRYVAPPVLVSRILHRLRWVLTFKNRTTPANRIRHIALPLEHIHGIPKRQVIPPLRILCENLLELLRNIPALIIIGPGITSMFRPMHILQIDPEQRIRQPRVRRRVREIDVYDESRDDREQDAKAQPVEADERVVRRDDTVAVLVEEVAVLLQDGLVCMFLGPVVGERAERAFGGRCDVDACGACWG